MARIAIKIFADVAALKSSLADADGELSSFRDKVSASGKKMMQAGAGMTAGLTVPIIGMGKSFVDAASDMAETSSKVQTLFGDQAAEIEAWAETSATSFGQSKKAALDAAGTFGNMFMQLGIGGQEAAGMSKNITELASDFASFHNTSPEEAIQAIGAAFRGEFDSVQKYVPTITAAAVEQKALQMGLKRSTGELTAQDKALATNALLFEGAGEAVGDFDRTSDGAANTNRKLGAEFADLRAELGEKLLPVYQRLQEMVKGLIDWFSGLTDGQQKLILIFGGVIAVVGPLVLLMGALATAVTAVSWPVLAVIAGVAALTAAVIYAYKNWDWFKDAVDAVGQFFKEKFIPVMKELWAWFKEKIMPILEKVYGFVKDYLAFVFDYWSTVIGDVVIPVIKQLWEWFNSYLVPVFQLLWDAASKVWSFFRDNIVPIFGRVRDIAGELATGLGSVASTFGSAFQDAYAKVAEWVDKIVDFVWGLPDRVWEGIKSVADKLKKPFVDAFNGIIEIYNKTVAKLPGVDEAKPIQISTSSDAPGRGGTIGAPRRAFADGGVIPGRNGDPLEVLAHGGELVLNQGQQAAVAAALAGNGGGTTVVNITVNGGDPQQVVAALRQYTRDNGASWMTSVA